MGKRDESALNFPEDLTTLSDEELSALEEQAVAKVDAITSDENIDEAGLAEATRIVEGIERVRGESTARTEAAAARKEQLKGLKDRLKGQPDGEVDDGDEVEESGEEPVGQQEPVPVAASGGARTTPRSLAAKRNLNPKLGDAARHAPAPEVPPTEATIVASANVPGFSPGHKLRNNKDLAGAVTAKAMTLGDDGVRYHVAQVQTTPRHIIDAREMGMNEMEQILREATAPETLVAAGGWCAPSEIRYDFYNVIDTDGMIDLPTVGIRRGGVRWPTSPTYADIVDGSTGLWSWNETQDIAAATGTAQSGTKTCVRIPCPGFNEARLSLDGLCVTAGNLMSDAYPEVIANFLRILEAGHAHYMNARRIAAVVAGSTAVTFTTTGHGVVIPVLEAVELQVIDYRSKFRMSTNAVLEAKFPIWILGMMRADMSKRYGVPLEYTSILDSQIAAWFSARDISVQFIQDYQLNSTGFPGQSTPATAWPTSVKFLLYAPGTWVLGTGMKLDLGVVRDSTLNETNDYTAAWMEEAYLVAKFGHESREVTVPVCANGVAASAVTMGCTG